MRSLALLEFLAEVVQAIEGHDDAEIREAFLDFRAHASQGVEALAILALHPAGQELRDEQHEQGRRERAQAQPPIEREQEDAGAQDDEEVPEELHQGLREELIELIGIVIDAGDEVPGLVLIEEGDGAGLRAW